MFKKKFSANEKIMVARKLGYLLKGGASLVESFGLVGLEFKTWKSEYISSIIGSLVQGKSLHKALGTKPILFDSITIHFIKMGEMTGTLGKSFEQISERLRKNLTLKRKLQGVLTYPLIVLCAACILVVVLLVFVFPKITSIFSSVHMKLPLTTRLLMRLSAFMQSYWILLCGSLGLFLFLLVFSFKRSRTLKRAVQKFLLRCKPSKLIFQPLYLKNFCQLFGHLLQSGVSLIEVISILKESNIAEIYKKSCSGLEEAVVKGKKISTHFQNEPLLFPPLTTSFISTGENSGNLSDSFLYLAEMYEESAETILTKLSSLIEPLTMILLGSFIGLIALSIVSPIYQLTSSLNVK